jgi:hypothetical protein
MRELRPMKPAGVAGERPLLAIVTVLLTKSLVLYLSAVILQRLWTLLNSDVLQLIRRVH